MTLIKSISGIRGTIGGIPGENLTPLDTVKFAAAYGSWLIDSEKAKRVVVGRDARLSGEMISQLVVHTLTGLGIDVIDCGLSTTPSVEWAVESREAGGGIIITASHNPIQWNALKLLNEKGEFISAEEGKDILERAETGNYSFEEVKKLGRVEGYTTSMEDHVAAVADHSLVDTEAIRRAGFSICVDGVNSTGGIAVPLLLKSLGVAEVEEINCEPNGRFAHNPEPLPDHLGQIMGKMERGDYHLGIVVDPDVDRLAFICEDGSFFGEEYTLVSIADYVLQNRQGPSVSNLSSTRALQDIAKKYHQEYHSSAVGEVNVVAKMKEVNAVIGGEGNGGIIVPDFHYGRDALIGIALFLTHLAKNGSKVSKLRSTYPSYYMSKNKIELTPAIDVDMVLDAIALQYKKYPVNREDGVKIDFEGEWVHLRKSNTEPIIRIYSEAGSESQAQTVAMKLVGDIREIVTEKAEQ